MKIIIEWLIAAGIVGGLFVALPISGEALALAAIFGLTVLIGGR